MIDIGQNIQSGGFHTDSHVDQEAHMRPPVGGGVSSASLEIFHNSCEREQLVLGSSLVQEVK